MKKILMLSFTALFISLFMSYGVYASTEKVYVNNNGIVLTEKEYSFVNTFYGNDYFENMTQDDLDWISDLDINNKTIYINTINDEDASLIDISSRGPYHSTNSKSLSIAKSCDNVKCTILTNLTWLVNPYVRSYDVIGARFSGTSLYNTTITTKVSSSLGNSYFSNNKFLSNGFGTSVKLPDNATNLVVEQKFYVNVGGTVYASYQHATTNISLSNSYYYTISPNGLGGVFNFYGAALGVYDGMAGVDI